MLARRSTGLLVVDIQGKLARLDEGSESLIANTARLGQGAKALGLPVVWLEQNPDKLGATVPELQPQQAGALVLPKFSFGALGEPTVADALAGTGVSHWLVCGTEPISASTRACWGSWRAAPGSLWWWMRCHPALPPTGSSPSVSWRPGARPSPRWRCASTS